jgi:phage gp36-like protein
MALATLSDFIRLGIPATALVPPPREIEIVDVGTGRILTKGHGLVSGDLIKFEAQGVLPVPLIASTLYEATPVDLDLFTVALAGVPVVLTSSGTKPYQWRIDPRPVYEQALEAASATVQDHATAHGTITSPTQQVIEIVCILAAWTIVCTNRLNLKIAEQFRTELRQRYEDAWITLRTWQKGKPIAGITDATPTLAETGAVTGGPIASPNGWNWGVGL